ncbi:unnamed protein product [Urochloa humidicola]
MDVSPRFLNEDLEKMTCDPGKMDKSPRFLNEDLENLTWYAGKMDKSPSMHIEKYNLQFNPQVFISFELNKASVAERSTLMDDLYESEDSEDSAEEYAEDGSSIDELTNLYDDPSGQGDMRPYIKYLGKKGKKNVRAYKNGKPLRYDRQKEAFARSRNG